MTFSPDGMRWITSRPAQKRRFWQTNRAETSKSYPVMLSPLNDMVYHSVPDVDYADVCRLMERHAQVIDTFLKKNGILNPLDGSDRAMREEAKALIKAIYEKEAAYAQQ